MKRIVRIVLSCCSAVENENLENKTKDLQNSDLSEVPEKEECPQSNAEDSEQLSGFVEKSKKQKSKKKKTKKTKDRSRAASEPNVFKPRKGSKPSATNSTSKIPQPEPVEKKPLRSILKKPKNKS